LEHYNRQNPLDGRKRIPVYLVVVAALREGTREPLILTSLFALVAKVPRRPLLLLV
jgi:hypothetical protein